VHHSIAYHVLIRGTRPAESEFVCDAAGRVVGLRIVPGNELDRGLRDIAARLGLDPEDLFRPLRVALAGQLASPGLFEIMRSLGKLETLAAVERALIALGDQATT